MTVLDEINNARSFERSLLHPSLAEFASRWTGPAGSTEGFSDGYLLGEDLVVTSKKFKTTKRCSENMRGIGRIVFLYHLDGTKRVSVSDGVYFEINEPSFIAYSQPMGVVKTSFWEEGECEMSLGLGFDSKRPPQIVAKASSMIGWLGDLLEFRSNRFQYVVKPMTPEMELTARALLEPSFKKAFLETYLAAKAQELFCLTLETSLRDNQVSANNQSDLEQMISVAQRLIENDPSGTMSLESVADAMRVSHKFLLSGIEAKFGLTAHRYCAMVRMNYAKHLLMSSNLPLKKIAYRTGYGHTSNFCVAFKRCFGKTPTDVRNTRYN